MKPRGQDTADAIIDWSKKEIVEGPAGYIDLGKFFFTVSSSSIGVVVALAKVSDHYVPKGTFWFSLGFYGVASIVAIFMAKPGVWVMTAATDLFDEYIASMNRGSQWFMRWLVFWGAGTGLAIAAFYPM